jgi:hypothetical protein
MERRTPLKLSSDCAREVGEEKDTRIATPLEKLHHKSSAIKVHFQTEPDELLDYLFRLNPWSISS